MIQRDLLLFIYVLVSLSFSFCISKPTTSANHETTISDTEFKKIIHTSVNEILLSDNGLTNAISDKDLDYRTKYAAQMLSYMNRSVYPCDDFYEYACGNWKNVIEERQGESKRNNLLDISYKLNELVEELLQRNDIEDLAPQYANEFELSKKFYYNCLDAELYPMRKSSEYLDVLKQIGGFPAVDSTWIPDKFSWLNMSAHLSNYGVDNLIKESIIPQYPFPAYFKIPDFGFDIELHHDNIENNSSNAFKLNEKRMHDILTLYGVESDRIGPLISNIFDFLKEVLNVIKRFNEDDYECSYLSSLLEDTEVEKITEQWYAYYDIAWMGKGNFTDGDDECCKPCAYLYKELNSICDNHKEAVANYLSLKFLYHMDARLKDKKFQKEYCILTVRSSMRYLIDHLYMTAYVTVEIRNEVFAIIKEIRESLRIILKEADWLDEETRNAALLKESTINAYVGRYEDINMTKRLIDEIKNLKYFNGDFMVNYLNLRKFSQYMKRFSGLHYEEFNNTTTPLILLYGMQINAFYYPIDNAIYLMAGDLITPVFHKLWPNAMKFGALGWTLGHEFTHGFDTMGAYYDETGHENFWWSKKSSNEFEKRIKCFINQYDKYHIAEINRNINGIQTLDENIADAGGLREAFMAYRRYTKSLSKMYKEEQMPGLDLSPEQLFFLAAAQKWCSAYKEADYWKELSDYHTMDKYRVLGAFSNNIDFANVFNCSVGSNMNSVNKCKIW